MALTSTTVACAAVILVATSVFSARAQRQAVKLPPNTLDCLDFSKMPDGSWQTHPNAKPFDFGTSRDIHIAGMRITPKQIAIDNIDLSDALNAKCSGAAGTNPK